MAQINIKVGYGLGLPQLSTVNNLLNSYNPPGLEVVEPFGSLNFIHGIQLGLRYKTSNTGIEVGWETMSRDRSSLAFNPTADSFNDRTYDFNISSFHVGLEHYFDQYGLGIALHTQKLGINRVIGNNELVLLDDRNPALRLQFIWQVQQSDLVSFAIKPYYQLPFGSYDLSRLSDDLGVSTMEEGSLSMFGLSFVFYNGRQF